MRQRLLQFLPWLALLAFATITTLGVFASGVWGCAGIGVAVFGFLVVTAVDHRLPRPTRDILILTFVALGVMALCNLQSVHPQKSWQMLWQLATIFLPLSLFTNGTLQSRLDHSKLFTLTLITSALGAFALGVELYLGGPMLNAYHGQASSLTEYNRGVSYLVMLAPALLAALRLHAEKGLAIKDYRARIFSVVYILILLFPTSYTESRASKLALILALAVIICAYLRPRVIRYVLSVLPVLFLGWPFAAQWFFRTHYELLARFPGSWRARIEIWDYMSYRIMEKPWLGWGLGTSGMMDFKNPDGAKYIYTTVSAGHSHNVVTQLWVELGLPGLALGLAFAWLTLSKAAGLDRRLAPFAMGTWMAALCLSMVAYNFWTDSLFATFALVGLAFALLQRRLPPEAIKAN